MSGARGIKEMGKKTQRLLRVFLAFALLCALVTGCMNNETPQKAEIPKSDEQKAPESEAPIDDKPVNEAPAREVPAIQIPGSHRTSEERASAAIDIDLTVLSATVLSAEVMNILVNAEDYLGKTIRVSGLYYYIHYEPADKYFHLVITKDGDSCCLEGIEFRLNGDPAFPDAFPPMRTQIEIDGVFSVHEEFDAEFYYLAADEFFLLG